MRAGLSAQRVRHRAAARAAADDDDVVAFGPHQRRAVDRRRVHVVHQPLIVDRALEAHLGRAPLRVMARVEIAIHRLIAADVAEAREARAAARRCLARARTGRSTRT